MIKAHKKALGLKEERKLTFSKHKETLATSQKTNDKLKKKVADLRSKVNSLDRTDIIGMRKKLEKLKAHNTLLKSLKKQ